MKEVQLLQREVNRVEKKAQVGLLGMQACYAIVSILINTFLIAQIFEMGRSILHVAFFSIIHVSTLFLAFSLSAVIAKKTKPTLMIRISAVMIVLFLVLLFLLEGALLQWYLLFAFIWGLIDGSYWGSKHYLDVKVLKRERVAGFVLLQNIISVSINLIFPVSIGFLIDSQTFIMTVGVMIVVGVALVVFTNLVHVPNSKMTGRPLALGKYFAKVKQANNTKSTTLIMIIIFLQSFTHAASLLLPVIIIMAFGSNLSLGYITTIFGVASIIAIIIYRKIKFKYFWPFGIILFFSGIPLLFTITVWSVVLFQGAKSIMQGLVQIETGVLRINNLKYINAEDFTAENQIMIDFCMFVGRLICCIALIVVGLLAPEYTIWYVAIIIIGVGLFAIGTVILYIWNKRYLRILDNNEQQQVQLEAQVKEDAVS